MAKVLSCIHPEIIFGSWDFPGFFEYNHLMRTKSFEYYTRHERKSFADQKQMITYSFNEKEHTITGVVEEKENLIFLYEYRGRFVGTEFFISFSKESISYKLIKVNEMS